MQRRWLLAEKSKMCCGFPDVNKALHRWYLLACSKFYLVGPQVCEKAEEIAECLGISVYKASNRWLNRWKKRYDIRHVKIHGESGRVVLL